MALSPKAAPVPPDLLFLSPEIHSPSPCFDHLHVLHPVPEVSAPPSIVTLETSEAPILPRSSTLWVNKVKSSFQPLTKVASPTVSEDGIPSIKAPDSINLTSSNQWKDHLVAFFHGTPPSPAKIAADLSPVWGKNGKISVRKHSSRTCLIYIPCPVIRQWALDVGLWHSGNCSFTLSTWQRHLNLVPEKLEYAPVWVLFKKIPQELWSLPGFNTMASGVGFPLHSEFSELKPYTNGVIKLRVVVELAKKRPSTLRVTDKLGNEVFLSVEFQKIPPRCSKCGDFGHLHLRCPEPNRKHTPLQRSEVSPPYILSVPASSSATDQVVSPASKPGSVGKDLSATRTEQHLPSSPTDGETNLADDSNSLPVLGLEIVPQEGAELTRSKSLPLVSDTSQSGDPSKEWTRVVYRSKPSAARILKQATTGPKSVPLTDVHFAEEEELIKAAQTIIRSRLASVDAHPQSFPTAMSRRNARRKYRQKLYQLSESLPSTSSNRSKESHNLVSKVGSASVEQASLRPVLPHEA